MKIYTKRGDKGKTYILSGEKVDKDITRLEAYGSVDELNSFIGFALCETKNEKIKNILKKIQNDLFVLGSDLAAPLEYKNDKINIPRVTNHHIEYIEKKIDDISDELKELKNFILPGGSKSAALLHICRTVCRRAERLCVKLQKEVALNSQIIIYLNRLSDFLFVAARLENKTNNIDDVLWIFEDPKN